MNEKLKEIIEKYSRELYQHFVEIEQYVKHDEDVDMDLSDMIDQYESTFETNEKGRMVREDIENITNIPEQLTHFFEGYDEKERQLNKNKLIELMEQCDYWSY